MAQKLLPEDCPIWYDGKTVNEALFCSEFLENHQLLSSERQLFTPEGLVTDDTAIREAIYRELAPYASSGISKKIQSLIELLKISAYVADFPPEEDRINLANGTLFLDGSFDPATEMVVRSRLPIYYQPDTPKPELWLRYLDGLLWPEDIPTLQEYIGYCLLPTNKAQRMMIIKGAGGEGKSQIGTVVKYMFGSYCKDGSISKISGNRFARADMEFMHLVVDDDMDMEHLRSTNYVKSLTTAKGRMDLEEKGKQSYQGYVYARLLGFSNGNLQSLYDHSNGFYRRQLILTTKDKDPNRVDDPDLGEKLCGEA